jgi:hypothetical protein
MQVLTNSGLFLHTETKMGVILLFLTIYIGFMVTPDEPAKPGLSTTIIITVGRPLDSSLHMLEEKGGG